MCPWSAFSSFKQTDALKFIFIKDPTHTKHMKICEFHSSLLSHTHTSAHTHPHAHTRFHTHSSQMPIIRVFSTTAACSLTSGVNIRTLATNHSTFVSFFEALMFNTYCFRLYTTSAVNSWLHASAVKLSIFTRGFPSVCTYSVCVWPRFVYALHLKKVDFRASALSSSEKGEGILSNTPFQCVTKILQ